MPYRTHRGFTLLEMSIVLTIIALVIGGIMIGNALIRTAKVNNIIAEMVRYKQAVVAFQDKYQAFPGDYPSAESMWGTDPGGCPTPTTGASPTPWNASPHVGTCNGDGNGLIGPDGVLDVGGYVASGPGAYEWYRAWQQLADSGLVEGSYCGIIGPSSANNAVVGVNVPVASVGAAGYMLLYSSNPAGTVDWWPVMNHVIVFGSVSGTAWTYGPALTPSEAFGIDTKVDDGVPGTGKLMTFRQNKLPNCDTTDVITTAQYNTTYKQYACNLVYDLGL